MTCPICNTEKVKRVKFYARGKSQRVKRFKVVSMDYEMGAGEWTISVYCPECKIMFEEA